MKKWEKPIVINLDLLATNTCPRNYWTWYCNGVPCHSGNEQRVVGEICGVDGCQAQVQSSCEHLS